MPYAPTPCKQQGCYELATSKGACDQHQPQAWIGSHRKETLPRDWNTRRVIVLKRDKGVCHICGKPGADSVDHIKPGEDHTLENLAPAHLNVEPYCHRIKSSKEGLDTLRAMRPKPKH